jgi:hypothetical protein
LNTILVAIKPADFEQRPWSWITALHDISGGQAMAIDGKMLRGSFDAVSGKAAIHMVRRSAVPPSRLFGGA